MPFIGFWKCSVVSLLRLVEAEPFAGRLEAPADQPGIGAVAGLRLPQVES